MTAQEQHQRIIETHNLAPDANLADFVDNLVRGVEYCKPKARVTNQIVNKYVLASADTIIPFIDSLMCEKADYKNRLCDVETTLASVQETLNQWR